MNANEINIGEEYSYADRSSGEILTAKVVSLCGRFVFFNNREIVHIKNVFEKACEMER